MSDTTRDERHRMRALIEATTDDMPTPPTFDAIRARLDEDRRAEADRDDGMSGRGDVGDGGGNVVELPTAPERRNSRPLPLLMVAAVLLIGAGTVALVGLARDPQSNSTATGGAEDGSAEIAFNCFESTTETVLDADGNPDGEANITVQQSCRAAADGSSLTVLDEERMRVTHGPESSPDGRYMAVVTLQGEHRVIDAETGEIVITYDASGRAAWLPDGSGLVVQRFESGRTEVVVMPIATPDTVEDRFVLDDELLPDAGPLSGWSLWSRVVSPDGRYIATTARYSSSEETPVEHDDRVLLFDRSDGSIRTLVERERVTELTWAPDGGLDISVDTSIVRYDPSSGSATTVFDGGTDHLFGHSYSPDGRTIAMIDGATLRLLDLETGDLRAIGDESVQFVSLPPDWSADGRRVVSGAVVPEGESVGPRIATVDVATGTITILTVDGDPVSGTYPTWLG